MVNKLTASTGVSIHPLYVFAPTSEMWRVIISTKIFQKRIKQNWVITHQAIKNVVKWLLMNVGNHVVYGWHNIQSECPRASSAAWSSVCQCRTPQPAPFADVLHPGLSGWHSEPSQALGDVPLATDLWTFAPAIIVLSFEKKVCLCFEKHNLHSQPCQRM